MKLLSLNTHSLHGENFGTEAAIFLSALLSEQPDLVALQEVNQPRGGRPPEGELPLGHVPCRTDVPMNGENYALWLARALAEKGKDYFWSWLPMKVGYGRYDEGLAVLCRRSFAVRAFSIGAVDSYEDHHTRWALTVRPEGWGITFCNLHLSRWNDPISPFSGEWERLTGELGDESPVVLMGDFNAPAEVRGEGYDLVSRSGFYDAYELADTPLGRGTAREGIDGWRKEGGEGRLLRIDQIRPSRPFRVREYRTVFDGKDYPRVSDHFGVLVTMEEEEWNEE